MRKKKEKSSMQKAFDFWTHILKKGDPKFYRAGCEWMINFWQQRMIDGHNIQ
jgi:hypothetical protein